MTQARVLAGTDAAKVPQLVDALTESLRTRMGHDPLVQAAMAHLNLIMIHPFRESLLRLRLVDLGEVEAGALGDVLDAGDVLDLFAPT